MQPHQERVVAEKAELDAKIEKLSEFIPGSIMGSLPAAEQSRLRIQLHIMQAYSTVLGERIYAFTAE